MPPPLPLPSAAGVLGVSLVALTASTWFQVRLRRSHRLLVATHADLQKSKLELQNQIATLQQRLNDRNDELDTFSYSVSHDLRAPLRSIHGFSRALLEDYEDKLDADGTDNLRRVCAASERMSELIDGLLKLSRVTREELSIGPVDLSALADTVADRLRKRAAPLPVEFVIAPDLLATGDARLLQIVLENLLGNADKFSRGRPLARIEFGMTIRNGERAYFVRDNGVGFDSNHARKLFGPFQRFHSSADFPGAGIGLATVQRIIHRHGGQVTAESQLGCGATFYFTLPGSKTATS